jgi:hypothetical protein
MSDAAVFFAIVFGGLALWFLIGREKPARYRRKTLLTGRERDFYYRLRRALPDCLVFPRMSVSALIEPTGIGRLRESARAYIEGQKVGYAVFDMEMRLVSVIELDHGVRLGRRITARDAIFASAGIPIVRFQTRHLPSEANIRSTIFSRPNTRSAAPVHSTPDHSAVIEFKPQKTPWRNTRNVHI